jgi:hypothetical protein
MASFRLDHTPQPSLAGAGRARRRRLFERRIGWPPAGTPRPITSRAWSRRRFVRSPVTRLPASRRPDGSRAAPDRPSNVGITHMPVVPHEATSRMRGTELFATDRLTIHVYHGRIEIAPGFGLSSATETRPPKAPPVLSPLQALEEVGIPPPSAGPRPRTTSARRPITSSRAGPPARNIWKVGVRLGCTPREAANPQCLRGRGRTMLRPELQPMTL